MSTVKKGERKITDFGKEVKKKLIDMEQTQTWLAMQVSEKTGIKFNVQYINNILAGDRKSARVESAIKEILGLGYCGN